MEVLNSCRVLGISKFGGFSRDWLNSTTHTTFKSVLGLKTPRHQYVGSSKFEVAISCLPSEPAAVTTKPKRGRPRKKKAESNEKPDLNASEVNLGDNVTKSSSAEKRGRKKKGIASVEAFLDTSLHNLISETEAGDSTLNQVSQTGKGPTPANFEPVAAESNNDIHFDGSDDKEPQLAVVEEEDEEWVDDEDVEDRWKVRASDFFKEPLISNVVGEDGTLIDWEGEADNCIIQEICNMEWDDMAFHPTPLVVLVFERYTRICDNWKALKELEKAFQVYWESHNKLPPRTAKIDAKIEKDLASALRVKDTPEILFIRGGKLLYRETEVRTANELVQMIAHFYYNAKRPTWLRDLTRMPDKA